MLDPSTVPCCYFFMFHGFSRYHLFVPKQSPSRRRLLPHHVFFPLPPPFCICHYPHPTIATFQSQKTDISSSFDFLLQRCATLLQCKQVHSQVVLVGAHHWSAFLAARFVSVYSRFGLLEDARSVFLAIHDPNNSLLWNSILRANLSHGHHCEALILYGRMKELGVVADGFTFPLVIRACSSFGDPDICQIVHSHAVVSGYQFHLHVANELILMYGNNGRISSARRVFDRMTFRSVASWNILISSFSLNFDCDGAFGAFRQMESELFEPNTVTWTSLLSAHTHCGQNSKALEFFGEMRTRGIGPTPEIVSVILSVCADLSMLEEGREIHGYVIRSGFEGYVFVRNSLICLYGKLGNKGDAEILFSGTEVKSIVSWNARISCYSSAGLCDRAYEIFMQMEKMTEIKPNVVSWSAVIGGFASSGMEEMSLELFRRMQEARVRPNAVTVATILSVCAELAAMGSSREIHCSVIRSLMDKTSLVGNGLVNMYAKCGSVTDAQLVFERIEDKDVISWNSMISGYGMNGLCENALSTFDEMVKSGFHPDGITFIAVLSACSHAGFVSRGRQLFDQIIHLYKILPSMEHYACMVDLLGRAGFIKEASEMVETMPMEPNACVWGALLNSCRIHRDAAVAEETALQAFHLKSESTAGSYMLLSNIYAASGRWEESAKVRVLTKARGLRKTPGQSWIEVKKKVCVFSAGKALPPEMEEVYIVLEGLSQVMESEGFHVPNDRLVLAGDGQYSSDEVIALAL